MFRTDLHFHQKLQGDVPGPMLRLWDAMHLRPANVSLVNGESSQVRALDPHRVDGHRKCFSVVARVTSKYQFEPELELSGGGYR